MNIQTINKFTEPSATAFNVRRNHPEGKRFKNMIIIDGGGSSIDSITVLGKDVYESKASNTNVGGDALKQKFEQVVARSIGFSPTEDQMNQALTEGKITAGSKVYDVSNLHQMLHMNLAETVIKEINGQLTATDQSIHTMDALVLTGRLFTSSPNNKTVVDFITENYKDVAGLTIINTEDEFSICKGAYGVMPQLHK